MEEGTLSHYYKGRKRGGATWEISCKKKRINSILFNYVLDWGDFLRVFIPSFMFKMMGTIFVWVDSQHYTIFSFSCNIIENISPLRFFLVW